MILLMRNRLNEFVPGHDYTMVKLDAALIETIARRVTTSGTMRAADSSLAELRYWDASPQCVGALNPDTAESMEEALDRGNGWAILDDDALGSFEEAKADCTLMAITACESPSIAWAYRVGSEFVRTVDVPLGTLSRRLGKPLGNPLKSIL